jgi:hypothetical protein
VRDVQKELQNHNMAVLKHCLELVNVLQPLIDILLRKQFVNLGNEHVLVMRSIEDLDHPSCRNLGVHTPQEVVA